jgi:tetratricopeptide (TPR) repeat protein
LLRFRKDYQKSLDQKLQCGCLYPSQPHPVDIMFKTFTLIAASIAILAPVAQAVEIPVQVAAQVRQIAETRSPEQILRSAMQKYESQDLQGALAEFDELIDLKPDAAIAYASRGNVKDDLGNPEGALADYDKALSLDRSDYSTYFNRGVTYARLEQYPQAITDFETAIELNAEYATAHRNLGMIKYLTAANKADKESGMADVRKSAELYKKQGEDAKAAESDGIVQQMQQDLTKKNPIN